MALWRILVRRVVSGGLLVYGFLTAIFFGFALTADPTGRIGGEVEAGRYGFIRGSADAGAAGLSLFERYLQWLSWYTTLDLGVSVGAERPVWEVLTATIPVTAAYLVPALAVATTASLAIGVYASLHDEGVLDQFLDRTTLVAVGLPAVVVADLLAFAVGQTPAYPGFDPSISVFTPTNLIALGLPAAVTAVNLGAIQFQVVRREADAYVTAAFVRTLRADGAGSWRIGRHVLRNIAPALAALFVAEVLLTLLVTVYAVEVAFGLPGFGLVSLRGFLRPDVEVIVPAVLIPVIVGVLGSGLQDIINATLDPRVDP